MITGGDLRQSRLDVGYKTFTISPWGGYAVNYVDLEEYYSDIFDLLKANGLKVRYPDNLSSYAEAAYKI